MRKLGLLKVLMVAGVSMMLIAVLSTTVKATSATGNSSTFSDWDTPTVTSQDTTTNTPTNTPASTPTNTSNNTGWETVNSGTNTNTGSGTNTNTNTNANTGTATTTLNTASNKSNTSNNSSVNSLAYTGIESNGILAVVAILGIGVAVYSFKKVKEYNNL